MSTLLLVEDNPHIMKINHDMLMMEGYTIVEATDGASCLRALEENSIDLILLDVMLPDASGIELCAQIKRRRNVPILFLSALGESEDIVAALRAGGDDYLAKPYDVNVLMARVEARLRSSCQEKRLMKWHGITFDTVTRVARYQNCELLFTQKEFSLLLILVRKDGMAVSKEELYETVWGAPLVQGSKALYTAVSRLNGKLAHQGVPATVCYERGRGYALTFLQTS